MSSRIIQDSFIQASSKRKGHPAHHARLGGKSSWCSQRERHHNYLNIDFPRKYKITSVSVNVTETYQSGEIYLFTQMLDKSINVYVPDKVINVDQDFIGKPEYEGYKPRKCERGWARGARGLGPSNDVLTTREAVILSRGQPIIAIYICQSKYRWFHSHVGKL